MVSPLDAHLGYWLRYVSNHVSHAFARKLAQRGVTTAEWVVMRALYDRVSLSPSALAEALGMTRGAITKLADRLVAKSLLRRERVRGDQRYQALLLTPDGRDLVPDLAALADANDAEFFGHLAPAERSALETALKEIVQRHALGAVPTD
ncbi:MAG: MarR family winged helix-turn-helix transcriptional regulator [Alphaproteobacteria bacterium]